MTDSRKAMVAYATENDGKIEISFGPGDHTAERWQISGVIALSLYRDLHKIIIERVNGIPN